MGQPWRYAWYAKKEYDNAIADYTEAIAMTSTNAGSIYNRGTAWYYKQEYDKAIADYTAVIELDPDFAGASSIAA